MKGKLGQIILVLMAGILFPYMAVLIAIQNGFMASGQEINAGYQIIMENGSCVESEQYLAGILAKQISAEYPMEVLKAQAVLARTWLHEMMNGQNYINEQQLGEYRWDSTCTDTYGDNYLDAYRMYYRAVFSTEGETIWYNENRIVPLYHVLSAGQTRDDSSGSCPYLIGRECSFDMEAEQFLQVQILEEKDYWDIWNSIDPNRQIEQSAMILDQIVWTTDNAGYVTGANVQGIDFDGKEIQTAFNLASPWMRMEVYGTRIRIISRGIGHGYGLSQWEAKRLAENGSDYRQILQYFFHGISIKAE